MLQIKLREHDANYCEDNYYSEYFTLQENLKEKN
jgi:hypothetical protein